MTGSSWIAHADRIRWQQQAACELAAILEEGGGLPLLAWTAGPAGGSLAGQAAGAGARAAFTAWQQALAMDEALETPVAGGTWRGGVRVTVTATVPAGNEAGS